MADPYLVFVSHSARDTWVARQIAKEIIEAGAAVFLDDQDIDVGDDFEEEIRDSLGRAHEVVVLITPWAIERPYIWSELGVAWFRRIPIVALLQGVTPSELQSTRGVPTYLKRRDMVDLNDAGQYFAQLRLRVEKGVGSDS